MHHKRHLTPHLWHCQCHIENLLCLFLGERVPSRSPLVIYISLFKCSKVYSWLCPYVCKIHSSSFRLFSALGDSADHCESPVCSRNRHASGILHSTTLSKNVLNQNISNVYVPIAVTALFRYSLAHDHKFHGLLSAFLLVSLWSFILEAQLGLTLAKKVSIQLAAEISLKIAERNEAKGQTSCPIFGKI